MSEVALENVSNTVEETVEVEQSDEVSTEVDNRARQLDLSLKRVVEEETPAHDATGEPKKQRLGCDDIFEETSKKDWSLGDHLLKFFNKYSKQHVAEKIVQAHVLDVYPTPVDLPKALMLDNHLETHLLEKQKVPLVDRDSDLLRIAQKLQAIMGPLGKVW